MSRSDSSYSGSEPEIRNQLANPVVGKVRCAIYLRGAHPFPTMTAGTKLYAD